MKFKLNFLNLSLGIGVAFLGLGFGNISYAETQSRSYSQSNTDLQINTDNISLNSGSQSVNDKVSQVIKNPELLKTSSENNKRIVDMLNSVKSNTNTNSSSTNLNQIAQSGIQQQQDLTEKRFSGAVQKSTKMLFCLVTGARQNECAGLVKEYLTCVAKPKCQPWNLIKDSASLTGAESANKNDQLNKVNQQLANAGAGSEDLGKTVKEINALEDKKMNDFMDATGNGHPNAPIQPVFNVVRHDWKNKPTRNESSYIGDFNRDGTIDNYFTCDVDPESGLNTKRELYIERYREDHHWRERYYLRTLTEMPTNCVAKKNYFPTTILPKYDSQKCNKAWYRADDYLRGYHQVRDKNGNIVDAKIEKDCWYIDLDEKNAIEKAQIEQKNAIITQSLKNNWSSDRTNALLYNLTSPSPYKATVPTK